MLSGLTASGTQPVRKTNHARILLKANDGWTDQQISQALNVSVPTIERVRQHFVEEGVQQALCPRKTRRKVQHLMDGIQEAHLVALACGQPSHGHRRWSLRLLASEMIRLEFMEAVSHATVRHVMQENELKPWLREEWCIPPQKGHPERYDYEYRREEPPICSCSSHRC